MQRLLLFIGLLARVCGAAAAGSVADRSVEFHIEAAPLAAALNAFAEQSGLQIVYDPSQLGERHGAAVHGRMPIGAAIERLLTDAGLEWQLADEMTLFVRRRPKPATPVEATAAARPRTQPTGAVATLDAVRVSADPYRMLPNEVHESVFGFAKSLLETPRSMSFISVEASDMFGLSAVEDLVRVVPGVFTTTRFGIQGSVDIRNVPADTFFRGMKRLSLQGHGRTVLAANDSIEIVRGPPSPLYGLGKIGGYTNVEPKSARAGTGRYLSEVDGFAKVILGSYDHRETSFGVGGPVQLTGRNGGYYVYGLYEDSDSFTDDVPIRQDVLQASLSVDDVAGPLRLETGASFQVSRTSGALTSRLTQDLVDDGRYIRGTPLVNLDGNGNGRIGYLEMQAASPARGQLSSGNQPLLQNFAWPLDGEGQPLRVEDFPRIAGIPQSLYDYLVAHPEADPTGALRAQGVGGPTPTSGYVPIGMALDPRTVGYDQLDLHRAAAYERELRAEFLTAFWDLVYDSDPNFTVKNQLFFDSMNQYKFSNQPVGNRQDVVVWEDKLTVTHRAATLPSWLGLNTMASVNARTTIAKVRFITADFSSHRTDAMADTWGDAAGGMTPNTTFSDPVNHPDLSDDGFPWMNIRRTQLWEYGLGLLFDFKLWERTSLLLGGRVDRTEAKNVNYAGEFNYNTGTSANPGAYIETSRRARAWDSGTSWTASLSHEVLPNVWPYVTLASSSIVLDNNNNTIDNDVIEAGHLGRAGLREVGVKTSLLDGTLFFSAALYDQRRTDLDADAQSYLTAYATATRTRGWEAEVKWVPSRRVSLAAYVVAQRTKYDPNMGGTLLVDARTLGFQDVLDAQGNVIYPAEAFLYGGRARIVLPNGVDAYDEKQGGPDLQLGLNASWNIGRGWGASLSGNYFSSTCSGRLCAVELPQARVLNAGAFWDTPMWSLKFDVLNLTNERYFRARTGDTLGDTLAQAMPDRRWQMSAQIRF